MQLIVLWIAQIQMHLDKKEVYITFKSKLTLMFTQRDKTKEQCKFIFGTEMQPCPSCGSYNLGFQTPIKTKGGESLKQLVAMSIRGGNELEGPVFIKCWKCHHAGPSLDCSGRMRDDVGRDAHVAATVKALWNSQALQRENI